jgi:hypothetical protein
MDGDMTKSALLEQPTRIHVVFDEEQTGDLRPQFEAFVAGIHGPWEISVEPVTIRIDEREIDRDFAFEVFDAFRACQGWSASEVVCILTPKPDSNHWYSAHAEDGRRLCYIDSRGWDWLGTVRPDAAIAYDLLQNVLSLALTEVGLDYTQYTHEVSIGCMFDFCQQKADWTLKLRTADICGDCLSRLEAHGASEALLRQIIEVLERARTTALSTSRYRSGEAPFARWPYPVAITRHKAAHEAEAGRQAFALLDHFDCLLRYLVFAASVRAGTSPQIEDRPSLGNWVRHFSATMHEPVRGQAIAAMERHRLVNYRNESRGHGWQQPEQHFNEHVPRLKEAITELESVLDPVLQTSVPVLIESASLTPSGSFALRGRRLAGSNLLGEPYHQEVEANPKDLGVVVNTIHLPQADGTWRTMSPFIRWMPCPECGVQRVLLSDGIRYIDAQMGHRVTI